MTASLPSRTALVPAPGAAAPRRRRLRATRAARELGWGTLVVASYAVAVVAFTGGWNEGSLVIDGPGSVLWVRLATENAARGDIPWWIGELWTGTPAWALAPSLPVIELVPLARRWGPERAVEVAALASLVAGGVGTYALVLAWWGQRVSAFVAGALFAFSPLALAHQGLFGWEPVGWVMAATPWFILATRSALRRGGGRRVVGTAAVGAFAVLHQAEYAYYVAAFGAALVAAELGRAVAWFRDGVPEVTTEPVGADADLADDGFPVLRGALDPPPDRPTPSRVVARAAAIALLTGGLLAFWLGPLLTLSDAFVLTPDTQVRRELTQGLAAEFGAHPEAFFTRTTFDGEGLPSLFRPEGGAFYLGAVAVGLAVAALPFLRRHDEAGSATAVAVVGLFALWLSSAGVPLGDSDPVRGGRVVGFVAVGAILGLVAVSLVTRLRRPAVQAVALLVVVAAVAAVPLVTPFTFLRSVVPLLQHVRFPRLYPGGAFAVVLLGGLALSLAEARVRARLPRGSRLVTAGAAALVLAAAAVDVAPYAHMFRLRPPPQDVALQTGVAEMLEGEDDVRIGTPHIPQAGLIDALHRTGFPLVSGWPHPLADPGVWRLTGAIENAPPDYVVRAMGVLAATHVVTRGAVAPVGARPVREAGWMTPVPRSLPFARVARGAVVLDDAAIAPELATGLAGTALGVVEGGAEAIGALGAVPAARVPADQVCDGTSDAALADRVLAGHLARACALARWVAEPGERVAPAEQRSTVGAVVEAGAPGLAGLAFDLDRDNPGPTRLHLWALDEAGRRTGDDLADVQASGRDADGLWVYAFPPVPHPPGTRFLAELACPDCPPGLGPWLRASEVASDGDVVVDGIVLPDRRARLAPIHGAPTAPGEPPPLEEQVAQAVDAEELGPGAWRIRPRLAQPGLLVVSVAAFPGWQAQVDGRPVPTVRADGGLVGVPLGAGAAEVLLRFTQPAVVGVGRAVTGLTLVASALLVLVPRRTRDRWRSARRARS